MKHNSTIGSTAGVIAGVALGALAMYMLDPVQGNRRRALARDKIYSAKVHAGKWANAKSRDIANRTKGICAKTSRMMSKSQPYTSAGEQRDTSPERQEASM